MVTPESALVSELDTLERRWQVGSYLFASQRSGDLEKHVPHNNGPEGGVVSDPGPRLDEELEVGSREEGPYRRSQGIRLMSDDGT